MLYEGTAQALERLSLLAGRNGHYRVEQANYRCAFAILFIGIDALLMGKAKRVRSFPTALEKLE